MARRLACFLASPHHAVSSSALSSWRPALRPPAHTMPQGTTVRRHWLERRQLFPTLLLGCLFAAPCCGVFCPILRLLCFTILFCFLRLHGALGTIAVRDDGGALMAHQL